MLFIAIIYRNHHATENICLFGNPDFSAKVKDYPEIWDYFKVRQYNVDGNETFYSAAVIMSESTNINYRKESGKVLKIIEKYRPIMVKACRT